MKLELEENTPRLFEVVWSIDRLVLGDRMSWLRRLWVRLFGSCLGREDIFCQEALLNELY